MQLNYLLIAWMLLIDEECVFTSYSDYHSQRELLENKSRMLRFDSNQRLTHNEIIANETFVRMQKEFQDANIYSPTWSSFREAKHIIDETQLFKLFLKMPKGSILHLHWTSMVPLSWLVKNATYVPNCYVMLDNETDASSAWPYGSFRFFKTPPGNGWQDVNKLRKESTNVSAFDNELLSFLDVLGNHRAANTSEDQWVFFNYYFARVGGLIMYRPVFSTYFYKAFTDLAAQHIFHVELRALDSEPEGQLYDLEDKHYSQSDTVELILEASAKVERNNPGRFFGVQIIANQYRGLPRENIRSFLDEVINLRLQFPESVVGYDLVGEEDPGHRLIFYADLLLEAQVIAKKRNTTLPYFFHAGETNWAGRNSTSDNLFDAVLFSNRIGHGLGLAKLPYLMDQVKEKDIAVEICPLSNLALQYADDVRDHPATVMLSAGVPITISPDDPSILGYEDVSYDWFMAGVSWDIDLASLKVMAINSIRYSNLNHTMKAIVLGVFNDDWNEWVQQIVEMNSNISYLEEFS